MFRTAISRCSRIIAPTLKQSTKKEKILPIVVAKRGVYSRDKELLKNIGSINETDYCAMTDEQLCGLYSKCADGFELRNLINEIHGEDFITPPLVVVSCLEKCRELNDYALAVRYLESVKFKCGTDAKVWDWMSQSIQPYLTQVGIDTPESLGIDKPILIEPDVDNM